MRDTGMSSDHTPLRAKRIADSDQVDAETGDEVDSSDIVKGYEVGKGEYIEIEPEELEPIAIDSKCTIGIDEFVRKKVPQDVIQNVAAPDGGAHVCFPKPEQSLP